jgi:hypothetical protein
MSEFALKGVVELAVPLVVAYGIYCMKEVAISYVENNTRLHNHPPTQPTQSTQPTHSVQQPTQQQSTQPSTQPNSSGYESIIIHDDVVQPPIISGPVYLPNLNTNQTETSNANIHMSG